MSTAFGAHSPHRQLLLWLLLREALLNLIDNAIRDVGAVPKSRWRCVPKPAAR